MEAGHRELTALSVRRERHADRSGSSMELWLADPNWRPIVRTENGPRFARSIPPAVCKRCGKTYQPKRKDRTTYCSQACAWDDQREAAGQRRADQARATQPRPPCPACGGAVEGRHGTAMYCSDACANRHHSRITYARHRAELLTVRKCRECEMEFRSTPSRRYCSHRCCQKNARRTAKGRRRAMLRSASVESVDPMAVFRRDKFRCQLCWNMTLRSSVGTNHPRAPSLDHIVPLSKGGEHSYRNTQCACRSCNTRKRSRSLGQLRLF